MTRIIIRTALLILLSAIFAIGQDRLNYRLDYPASGNPSVHISMIPAKAIKGPVVMVFPRAIPGGYTQVFYDRYVENVKATSSSGAALKIEGQQGSRWLMGDGTSDVALVEYDVNITKMEREIYDASETSKVRPGYVGLLGYSAFAYFDGMENAPIRLEINAPNGWPAFSTLKPKSPVDIGKTNVDAANFYQLADSQIAIGPKIAVRGFDARVPFFLLTYAEVESDAEQFGHIAIGAFEKVSEYFGITPFAHYTTYIEILVPVSERHEYGFSMEHLDSSTYFLGTDRAISSTPTKEVIERERFNFAHHFAHSWIPKKVYSTGYLPFNWELAPEIDTIWFNEGFGRFAAIDALADGMPEKEAAAFRRDRLDRLKVIIAGMPQFIRTMPLLKLSRTGSLMYGNDFRIGQTLFSKGALMAAEMDALIQKRTNGKKRLRDSLRALIKWSERSGRAFKLTEFPGLIAKPVGVREREIKKILDDWLDRK